MPPPHRGGHRQYRPRAEETPSHPGGVNREAERSARERKRDREREGRGIEYGNRDAGNRQRPDEEDRGGRREGGDLYRGDDGGRIREGGVERRRRGEYVDRGRGGFEVRDRRRDRYSLSTRSSSERERSRSSPPEVTPSTAAARSESRGRWLGGGVHAPTPLPEGGGRRKRWGDGPGAATPMSGESRGATPLPPNRADGEISGRAGGESGGGGWDRTPLSEAGRRSGRWGDTSRASTPLSERSREPGASTPLLQKRGGEEISGRPGVNSSSGGWDQTPLTSMRYPEDGGVLQTPSAGTGNRKSEGEDGVEDEDDDFDRQFYLADDDKAYVPDSHPSGAGDAAASNDMGRFLFDSAKSRKREAEMEAKRQRGEGGAKGARVGPGQARRSALADDQDAWEENRLLSSGAAVRGEVDVTGGADEDESRVTLLVHQVRPPFLEGERASFSAIRDAVPTVRDATSDFAKMAREGSETLRRLREKREKNAMRQRFWELGGTRMGKAMGVKEGEGDGDSKGGVGDGTGDCKGKTNDGDTAVKDDDTGEIDYRKTTGYARHMKKKDAPESKASSEFARTKSMRQQREYLPVFNVREELLNVIRENSVVVVVGETGSGKTTQLTQYLMEEGYTEFGVVGCTQPRRVAAMSVAKRVSEEGKLLFSFENILSH